MASQQIPLSVSFLITSHNSPEKTERCISAIREHCGDDEDILLVDDGSTIPLRTQSNCRVIRNEVCLGYVKSINRGLSELKSDLVVILDCDAFLLSCPLGVVKEAFEQNHELGILGFKLFDESGNATGAAGPIPKVMGFVLGQKLSECLRIESRSREYVCIYSCAMVVRRKCFDELGGFDESFDFLDADIDFSIRAIKKGWFVRQAEEGLRAIHEGSGSPQTVEHRVVRHHLNRYKLLCKHDLFHPKLLWKSMLLLRLGVEWGIAAFILCLRPNLKVKSILNSRLVLIRKFLFARAK